MEVTDKIIEGLWTCETCGERFECEYAFDDYNKGGRCLAWELHKLKYEVGIKGIVIVTSN